MGFGSKLANALAAMLPKEISFLLCSTAQVRSAES
jgi:hypothetical protein